MENIKERSTMRHTMDTQLVLLTINFLTIQANTAAVYCDGHELFHNF